jgi:hypothetical protein
MTARSPLILGMVLATLGSGCVDSDTFYIAQMQKATASASGAGCTADTGLAGEYRAAGVLDISLGVGYTAFPLLVNNIASSTTKDGQPERNILHLTGYRVSLDLGKIPVNPPGELVDFLARASGLVAPAGGMQVSGVKVIKDELVKIIAPAIPDAYQPEILVTLRAVATRGGWETESGAFVYPVTLCKKCLVDYRGTCPATGDKNVAVNACGLPQDDPVTCCPVPTGSSTAVKCYSVTP